MSDFVEDLNIRLVKRVLTSTTNNNPTIFEVTQADWQRYKIELIMEGWRSIWATETWSNVTIAKDMK